MVKVVALVNSRLGLDVARFLDGRDELVGLVVHPSSQRDYISEFDLREFQCWVRTWPSGLEAAREARPDYLLSVLFGFRVTKDWLEIPNCVPLNIHPGYLPDNRGRAPAAWPIMDGSRAGVTLHVMTEEFDTGPYLAREEVPIFPEDNGDTLGKRVEAATSMLFRCTWPRVGELEAIPQEPGGAYHSLSDITKLTLTDEELGVVDKLRARVYHGTGLRFARDDRLYEITVDVSRVG